MLPEGFRGRYPFGFKKVISLLNYPDSPLPTMPTKPMPDRDELVNLSEHLKRRLSSAGGRKSKGNISAEFQKELLGALEYLAELAADSPLSGELAADVDSAVKNQDEAEKASVKGSQTELRESAGSSAKSAGASTAETMSEESTLETSSAAVSAVPTTTAASADSRLTSADSTSTPQTSKTVAAETIASTKSAVSNSGSLESSVLELDDSDLDFSDPNQAYVELVSHEPAAPNQAREESTAEKQISTEALNALEDSPLGGLVAQVVDQSLGTFQKQIIDSIVRTLSSKTQTLDVKTLQNVVLELEGELRDTRFQLQAANSQLAEYRAELKFYHEQTEAVPSIFDSEPSLGSLLDDLPKPTVESSANDEHILQLQQQLEDALIEIAELREQNSDLAAQLAHQLASAAATDKQTGRGTGEQLTWEERKLLILKQLEDGSNDEENAIPHEERLSIQEVLDATQAEIARRDDEIDELREIIRMQSEARDGVAIGAAGVAQLLDSDELLQQERQKLREIQEEWEAKLRQAEIDLSMERAKIARERIALEKQKEEASQTPAATLSESKEKSKERRWLSILGLGEGGSE